MIVSHRHRFIFMKTVKTAGTSLELALSRTCGPDDVVTPLNATDEAMRAEVGGLAPQNFEATETRERLWEHVWAPTARRVVGHQVWDDYLVFAVARNPWDAVVSLYYWVDRHERKLTFEEFLDHPSVRNLAARNRGITRFKHRSAVDRTLRFENLDAEVEALWSELGLPGTPDLPRAKSTQRPRTASYRGHYDDRSRELIGREFATLIEEMGYEF